MSSKLLTSAYTVDELADAVDYKNMPLVVKILSSNKLLVNEKDKVLILFCDCELFFDSFDILEWLDSSIMCNQERPFGLYDVFDQSRSQCISRERGNS